MNKQFLLLLACLLLALAVRSQNVLTPVLQHEISQRSGEPLDVLVYLNDRFDPLDFHREMKEQGASKGVRVKQVQKQLKDIASRSQASFRDELLRLSERGMTEIVWEESFWIVNAVRLSVPSTYLDELASVPSVRRIDLNSERYTFEKPVKTEAAGERSEGGVEPGIEAINAPALWEMGYTGRNLLFLSMDTGVFPDHPAISDRFLGNNRPLNQVWYGVRSPVPTDHASSSHGTHTTGTVLGLIEDTNDTIGIAYSAYWIASDPVASSESDLLTPADFMAVFQWVLNPDGNEETTDDVPDVINNSWGYDYTLALQFDACNMEETQILEVIESAGILSPFSAGNEGPSAETTGFPAMLAFSELNVMSVGALNGNTDTYPVADFSSRGPTPCVETGGALEIKPEVSAPGVSVRSCSGQDDFALLSGTSMACPHVSGALLLLKEAYPMVDIVTLKESLYETAIDLGEPGEDNVYGRGMIDVLAAYNYLDLSYDPVPPVTDSFDLAIEVRQFGDEFICPGNETLIPKIAIVNKGQENLTQVDYSWTLNAGDTVDASWTGNLAAGEEILVDLDEITLVPGMNGLFVWGNSADITRDFDIYNNSHVGFAYVIETASYPYIEDAESYSSEYIDADWVVRNQDGSNGWQVKDAPSVSETNRSFAIDFSDYFPREGQVDELISSLISLPETDEQLNLSFDIAYKKRLEYLYNDSLLVYLSTDCGQTFPTLLYQNGGQDMSTVDGNANSVGFSPESAEDWDTVNLNVSGFAGQDIIVKFMTKNDRGSNLYIDNIRFYSGNADYIVSPREMETIGVFPNPARSVVHIKHEMGGAVCYEISNINGQMVMQNSLPNTSDIDVSRLNAGLYVIKVYNETKIAVKQLVIR